MTRRGRNNEKRFFIRAQILCVYHVGVCYICFDNLLCIVNLHVAGQFRILQHRLRSLSSAEPGDRRDARKLYAKLKSCVLHHQALTKYCKQLENIFTIIVLGQVLFLAVVICLVGFQLFLVGMQHPNIRFARSFSYKYFRKIVLRLG